MKSTRVRHLAIILLTVATVSLVSVLLYAAEYNFAGTWKGEYKPAPPAPPAAKTQFAQGRGGGGGAPGGGGFGGGAPAGFGGGGPQKITLRVKVNKDHASGNFTMGSSNPEDLREAKIEGNKLTFKTGTPPAAIYVNEAVINGAGDTLSVTRTAEGKGGGKPITFDLMRSK
jgi:hypothetical protein